MTVALAALWLVLTRAERGDTRVVDAAPAQLPLADPLAWRLVPRSS